MKSFVIVLIAILATSCIGPHGTDEYVVGIEGEFGRQVMGQPEFYRFCFQGYDELIKVMTAVDDPGSRWELRIRIVVADTEHVRVDETEPASFQGNNKLYKIGKAAIQRACRRSVFSSSTIDRLRGLGAFTLVVRHQDRPNQALEPTTPAVTIPAAQEVAPAGVVAHL